MEFCENGDLDRHAAAQKRPRDSDRIKLPEEQLWRIFLCLAKALLVMEGGTETPEVVDLAWGTPLRISWIPNMFADSDACG